jgi:hypothetical protein
MANPVNYRTLSELTAEVMDRLGFASIGSGAANYKPTIHRYLQDAQSQLLDRFNDMLREDVYLDDLTVVGETLYDLVEHCDPDRINKLLVRRTDNDSWCELKRGIPSAHRGDSSYTGEPYRYDVRYGTTNTAQVELFPIPDQVYQWGYEFNRNAERFTRDEDRTSVDSDLVMLLALANASEFYQLPNAQSIAAQAQAKLYKLQVRANKNIDVRRGGSDNTVRRRPRPVAI